MLGEGVDLVVLFLVFFVIGVAVGLLVCGVFFCGKDVIIFIIIGGFGMIVFLLDVVWQLVYWEMVLELVGVLVFMENFDNWCLLVGFFFIVFVVGMYIVLLQVMVQYCVLVDKCVRLLVIGNIFNVGGVFLG